VLHWLIAVSRAPSLLTGRPRDALTAAPTALAAMLATHPVSPSVVVSVSKRHLMRRIGNVLE
jgi:hypothetical protein